MTADRTVCAAPDCEAFFASNKWGAIRAAADGWFMQRDGTVWCPAHTPSWAKTWRARRAR